MNGFLVALAVAACVSTPTGDELAWGDDYATALEATVALQKPLLIVIDDPSDSKTQSRHILSAPEKKQADLLENYVLCHVDATTDYGKRVAEVFEVEKYPLTAIIDKTGEKIIYRNAGEVSDSKWTAALDKHKRGERRKLAVAASSSTPASEEPLWVDDYALALEATVALKKPLLIVIDDPGDKKTQSQFVQTAVEKKQADLLENYVLCHVDATTDYGKRVARVFEVQQGPLAAIIDKTGEKIIYRIAGMVSNSRWVAALDKHKRGERRSRRGRYTVADCYT